MFTINGFDTNNMIAQGDKSILLNNEILCLHHPVRDMAKTIHPIVAVINANNICIGSPTNINSWLNTQINGIINPVAASFIESTPVFQMFAPAIPAAAKVDKATGGVMVDSAPK